MTNIDQHTQIDFVAANQTIVDNIETILDHFELDYKILHNRVVLPCPIHGSSRENSLNIFIEGRESVGNFQCWTNHCEREIGYGVINLVKFLLESKQGKMTYFDVIQYLETITGSTFETISEEVANRRKFSKFVGKEIIVPEKKLLISRERVRENLRIPSEYYVKRGYSPEVLNKYDVGNCYTHGKQMFMRVVVPVYDIDGMMVGAVGRSLNDECIICGTYHSEKRPCPSNDLEKRWAAKWVNSDGFRSGHYWYNLNYAKEHISKTESVIIVEGQGDVWRMEESGIHNCLGLFGCELTEQKFTILAQLPIMNIYLALDADDAGLEATRKIKERLERFYNVTVIRPTEKDIGDMQVNEVKQLFGGVI